MGDATTRSHVGQALRIEIPLQLSAGESPDPSCFQVVPGNHEDDGIPWITNGRAAIEGSGATARLVLRAPATDAPAVRLAVRAACGANLRREYALLLEPPLNVESVPTVASGDAVAPQRGRSPQAASSTPDTPSTGAPSAPRRAASGNPRRPAVAQSGATRARPTPALVHESPPASPAVPVRTQTAAPAPKAAPHDQLVVGPSSTEQLAASLPPGDASAPVRSSHGRTEAELISELDDRIAQQIALTERLHRLEQLQTELAADNARLEAQVRQLRQSGGAVSAAQPVFSNDDSLLSQRWPYAIVAVLCLLAAWLVKRHKDRAIAVHSEGPHTVRLNRRYKGPASEDEDDVFAPLTERDLWPERSSLVPLPIADSVTESLEPILSIPSTPDVVVTEDIEEHDSAVELAEIMMSFGRVQGAAQTLADFIRTNPKQAVKPWIKLLEVYHSAGMRTEFDGLSAQINKTFNIQPVTWEDFEVALRDPASLESMTHIRKRLCETWNTRDCQAYLHALLRDNRDGTRLGFPLVIVDEILMLLGVLEQTLGHFRYEPPAPAESQPAPELPEAGQTPLSTSDTHTQLETWVDEVPELPIEIPPAGTAPRTPAQPNPFAGSLVDLDIDGQDFGKTLHFNLDELDGHTRPMPELDKKQA
ncbi:FimV family protein [Uliginosibacterium sp. sgz301328]|uniref:type IV pilus assembly protein FimV n=1 Tax=Uliginosibacterium sp. sgz301328 TaxID=3243764 RepID=UPI00359E5DE4